MTSLAAFPPTDAPMTAAEIAEYDAIQAELRPLHKSGSRYLALHTRVGEAKLYRHKFASFSAYLADEWGIHPGHAWRQIEGSRVAAMIPDDLPTPTREATTRPLLRIAKQPELVERAYRAAVDVAGGSEPTQKQVAAEVERVKPKPPKAGSADEAKARGVLPPDAVIEVVEAKECDHTIVVEGEELPHDLTDAEWLLTLPARASIPAGFRRDWFDADALFYRHTDALRDTFRKACTAHAKAAEKPNGGHRGRYLQRHYGHLRVESPEWWQACGDCKGEGKTLVGDCPSCDGAGYQLR
jgi:hypothetical protein